MPKFEVCFEATVHEYLMIDAETKEEAKNKAYDMLNSQSNESLFGGCDDSLRRFKNSLRYHIVDVWEENE